jgi:UDP-2,3-diacylglucosamine hydrolase
MTSLFISDLHLSTERPEKLQLFKNLLKGQAKNVEALYILGDLFERFWIGVDDDHELNAEVISTLADYALHGNHTLYIMRGNRDFYLDQNFESLTGCQLIPDPTVIDLQGRKTLLMHGDTLCTGDVHYQRWRRFITNRIIRKTFFTLPLNIRQKISYGVRDVTRRASSIKPAEVTDVNQTAVVAKMNEHGVQDIIHGHTHRQAINEFTINDKPARRIVLGAWYEKDCVLLCNEADFQLMSVGEFMEQN